MKLFAALFSALDETNKTNDRIEILKEYFRNADGPDKLWAIYVLTGRKIKRQINYSQMSSWAIEYSGFPTWLFEESYHSVGDLSETIALMLPNARQTSDIPLHEWIEKIEHISTQPEQKRKEFLIDAWDQLTSRERFAFNKLITGGGFRIGVSEKMIINALSDLTKISAPILTHRMTGKWHPNDITFEQLVFEDRSHTDISQPYPFFLAYPVEGNVSDLGNAEEWQAEWKWDGIRGQIIFRKNQLFVWSRGEELVTEKFPEFAVFKNMLSEGTVLDGEIITWEGNRPLPFQTLQTRIGRKNVTAKILKEAPVAFMVYDILEQNGNDVRTMPLEERRKIIHEIQSHYPDHPVLRFSPVISFSDWNELAKKRTFSRENHAEGIMLKRLSSEYQVGRKRGDWWKWKIDPYAIDAVLVYAQKGSGRRADLYTDYTFALWDENKKLVVFAKAYSGLTDKEIKEVDAFVRKNTVEKFGPVRTVTPELVFEIGFEGIGKSSRHKSGVALRFPRMLRWRKDKKPEEANTLEDLKKLL